MSSAQTDLFRPFDGRRVRLADLAPGDDVSFLAKLSGRPPHWRPGQVHSVGPRRAHVTWWDDRDRPHTVKVAPENLRRGW